VLQSNENVTESRHANDDGCWCRLLGSCAVHTCIDACRLKTFGQQMADSPESKGAGGLKVPGTLFPSRLFTPVAKRPLTLTLREARDLM